MINELTRLSLSLGGSWGSVGLGGDGGPLAFGGGDDSFFASLIGAGSALGVCFSTVSFSLEGNGCSDGATCAAASTDLEITATLTPGSTLSPSFAKSYNQ